MRKLHPINWGVGMVLFLLPWQTRWIFHDVIIHGQVSEFFRLSLYGSEVVLWVVFLVWMIEKIRTSRLHIRRHHIYLLTVGIGILLMSLCVAQNPAIVLERSLHVVSALMLFLIIQDIRISKTLLIHAFVAGLIMPILLSCWQVFVGTSPASTLLGLAARDAQHLGDSIWYWGSERMLRAYGSFAHPNIFGGYLAVALGLWWTQKSSAWLWRGTFFFLMIGLFFTMSLSAWIACVIGAFMLLLGNRKKIVFGVVGAMMTISFLAPLFVHIIPVPQSDAFLERQEQMQTFSTVMQGSDWLFGHGIGQYMLALQSMNPGQAWWAYQPVHNVPLLMLGEIGILGFVILGLIFFVYKQHIVLDEQYIFLFPGLTVLMLFDHYLWTTLAGLALFAVGMGFIWNMRHVK